MEIEWKYVKCGVNGNIIPRKAISYKGELVKRDILDSSTGKSLYYDSDGNLTIITDDPCNTWLNEKDLNSEWTKRVYPKEGLSIGDVVNIYGEWFIRINKEIANEILNSKK